jgi:hypothetical protein
MSDGAKQAIAVIALIMLALPTGLCSLYFAPMSIAMFVSQDTLSRDIGTLAAVMSGIGFLIAGVTIYFAVRVFRRTEREPAAPPRRDGPS